MNKVEKNSLEWCVFLLSSLLVLSVLGYLAYDAWTTTPVPPVLELHLGRSESRGEYYALPITLHNRGLQTAESVRVEVVLIKQDGSEERAELDFPFVARQSTMTGHVTFVADPHTAKSVAARSLGYRTQ